MFTGASGHFMLIHKPNTVRWSLYQLASLVEVKMLELTIPRCDIGMMLVGNWGVVKHKEDVGMLVTEKLYNITAGLEVV